MHRIKTLVQERIAALRLAPGAERDLEEELTQHLEDFYRDLESGGASVEEAYRKTAAELDDMHPLARQIGAQKRMPAYDAAPAGDPHSGNFADDLWRDVRYTLRGMRKSPLFVVFVVLTLALGIGANTTVFTIVNTLILNPLPVKDPSRLVAVSVAQTKTVSKANTALPISYPDLQDYRDKNAVFESLAGYTSPRTLTLQEGGAPQRMFTEIVTGNYFSVLGLTPARGRFFAAEEDSIAGTHPVAVISYASWRTRFAGTQDIAGKTLRLNNVVFTVIGVAPPSFIGMNAVFGPDLWIPAAMAEKLLPGEMQGALKQRGKPLFQGVGRLKSGVNRAQAEANLTTVAAALASEYPQTDEGHTAKVQPVSEVIFGTGNGGLGRTPIMLAGVVLLAIVGIVLLIACSNVANLLLARSASRQQEIAVRLAMGASRGRLLRQLLTESILLALMSGLAGFAVGYQGTRLLWSFRPAEVASNLIAPKLDASVFIFTLLLSLVTGLVFGIVPALRATRTDVAETLKEESRGTGTSRRKVTFANALLVGQVAFSFVALVTAALFLRSIERAYRLDPGFQTQHLALLMANPGQAGYSKVQTKAFYKETRERVAAMAGIESASWASNLPLFSRVQSGLEVEGRQARSKADTVASVVTSVDLGYFRTMGIALERGREFTNTDREVSLPVAMVNEKLAHDYWPGEGAVGKHIQLPREKTMRQIVGVVKTANYSTLGEPPQLCVYVPLEQSYSDSMVLYVRSKGNPKEILMPVQREVRAMGPQISLDDIRTGDKLIGQALFGPKMGVTLLSVFGLLALGLASIGLYGIMAYSVSRRRREIGLRMALGAARGTVVRLILAQGMSLVATGAAIGAAASLLVGRFLSKMLYGVSASDPASLGGAAVVLMAVALIACYLPARWASAVDPLVALREG